MFYIRLVLLKFLAIKAGAFNSNVLHYRALLVAKYQNKDTPPN